MTEKTDSKRKVIIVLCQASLETVKTKKGFELLNADYHKSVLLKHKRDPSKYRPDIVHQVLMSLLDSPLNKSGHLKVYIHTWNNVLIDVDPSIRIPRTFNRFSGLMVQLLHKLSIRASEGSKKLLKVIKNPITAHLPVGCQKISTSVKGELVNMNEFVASLPVDEPVTFMVGSHAHGECEVDWTEKRIAVSNFPLSAAACCSRICAAFESHWNIL